MRAPSLERLATLDLEELDTLRGWVENQRRDPSQDDEARRRLLERIDEAIRIYG